MTVRCTTTSLGDAFVIKLAQQISQEDTTRAATHVVACLQDGLAATEESPSKSFAKPKHPQF
jgi:hypothetical protein